MARRVLAVVAVLILIFVSVVPSDAGGRGGGHGGAMHGGHGHGWRHHGGCCWWGAAFIGGVALGAALAYPYVYPYPYAYPYPAYAYPYYGYRYYLYASSYPAYTTQVVTTQPPASNQQPQASPTIYPQATVQREVIYSHGKYVLRGDGVTRPWQWVWVPASPPDSVPTVAQSR